MGKKYLKRQNGITITIFLVWSIALFVVLCTNISDFWADMLVRISDLKAKDSLFCFLTPLILGIACGVLPVSWKAHLVFWRKNPLPGCRAFTKLGPSDPRIDLKQLGALIGDLPMSPTEQNATWYSLYKKVQNELIVSEAHKGFLLYRDLTGISFLFLFFGTIALIPAGASVTHLLIYVAVCTAQYIILSIVARNHGNRFVCNVLVEYLEKHDPTSRMQAT
ncbi:MAG: hypothetical protein KAR13_16795, partial [Desulfobulbaceae bacterium]|nr:hypothetical protein [Desulfobulbaceae bacterium]